MPTLGDKNISGFDVTMNDAFDVGSIEGIGNLDGNGDNTLRIERARGYQIFQRYTIHVLHGDERLAVVAPNFVDGADIRMVERRCASRFTAKAFERLRVLRCAFGEKLQSDKPAEFVDPGLCKPHPYRRCLAPPGHDSARWFVR